MDRDNMLSVLENYTFETIDDVAMKMAEDFRRRRIEKNLIALSVALGYTSEIKNLFATPKYATMEELTQIRRNTNKKKAYGKL